MEEKKEKEKHESLIQLCEQNGVSVWWCCGELLQPVAPMPWFSQQPQPITVWWGLRASISVVFVLGSRFSWMSISQLYIACGVPSLLSLSPPLPFPQVEPPSYLPPVLFPRCQCLLPERSVSFPSENFGIKYEIKYEVASLDHSVLFVYKLGFHFLILPTSLILIRIWGSGMLEVQG